MLATIFNEIKCHVNTSIGLMGWMHPLHPPCVRASTRHLFIVDLALHCLTALHLAACACWAAIRSFNYQGRIKGRGARGNFHWRGPDAHFMTSSFEKFLISLICNILVCLKINVKLPLIVNRIWAYRSPQPLICIRDDRVLVHFPY